MTNQIANTILQQLGGMNRISIMTGARNFVNLPNGVRFDLPRNVKVTIALNSADLYDIDVSKWNQRALKLTNKFFSRDVQVSELKETLETATGLRFSL